MKQNKKNNNQTILLYQMQKTTRRPAEPFNRGGIADLPLLRTHIEDQVKRNSRGTLVIRGIKKDNQEKTWNNTSHVLSSSFCGLFGWNPNQFLRDIERPRRGNYRIIF